MMSALNNILDFKVVPLRFSNESSSSHTLFIKEHSIRHVDERKPPGKTLFVLNVPPYATENSLKIAFSKTGRVKSVIFEKNDEKEINDGFNKAYVIYEKRESLLKVFKLDLLNPLSTTEASVKVGLGKWIDDYNSSIFNPKEIQNEINRYMNNYDERKKSTGKGELVDDEGWTVVTKKGRHPGISRKESVDLKLNERNKSGSEKKQLKNFYTFQIRESKMEHIAALRKSYEEAKNKINLMKKTRKFKPY